MLRTLSTVVKCENITLDIAAITLASRKKLISYLLWMPVIDLVIMQRPKRKIGYRQQTY